MKNDLVNRLGSLPSLTKISRHELQWLVQHGNLESYPPGLIIPKGARVEHLWIIIQGRISVRIDRGAGPKVVNTELKSGSVTGLLPYSRLLDLPGDVYADEKTEFLTIPNKIFPQMIHKCPMFTAHTVHTMIDRTRIYSTSAMQDEKMISMGRLAAGLAHELNNPASVAIRDTKMLREYQSLAYDASRMLSKAGLNDQQFAGIDTLRSKCIEKSPDAALSAIEKADLEDKLTDWLEQNQMDTLHAGQLADLNVTTGDLENLRKIVPDNVMESALKWIVADCSIHHLTAEIEQSTKQIHKLVEAVKKFTHMDNLAERELVDVETGIYDSLRVLDSKLKSKNAAISLEIDKDLPRVYANGAELNQVWFSLLDNALDAIPQSGKIRICAGLDTDFIMVRIIDNGPGIPSDRINKIFDPFYTTKPPGHGTGLGLDLSRRLVRSYNGDIYVRSEAGNTEFCVNLSTGRM